MIVFRAVLLAWALLFLTETSYGEDRRIECRAVQKVAEIVISSPAVSLNVYEDPDGQTCAFWVSVPAPDAAMNAMDSTTSTLVQLMPLRSEGFDAIFEQAKDLELAGWLSLAVRAPLIDGPFADPKRDEQFSSLLANAGVDLLACVAEVIAGGSMPDPKVYSKEDGNVYCFALGEGEARSLMVTAWADRLQVSAVLPLAML